MIFFSILLTQQTSKSIMCLFPLLQSYTHTSREMMPVPGFLLDCM